MNKIKIGKKYEKIGKRILENNGYIILDHTSKKNWGSHYDFEVVKDNKKFYVEVRGRENGKNTNQFIFSQSKLKHLKNLKKEVLILCINKQNHILFNFKKIANYTKPIKIGKNIIYVADAKKFKYREEEFEKEYSEFEKKAINAIKKKYKITSYIKVIRYIIKIVSKEYDKLKNSDGKQ